MHKIECEMILSPSIQSPLDIMTEVRFDVITISLETTFSLTFKMIASIYLKADGCLVSFNYIVMKFLISVLSSSCSISFEVKYKLAKSFNIY